MLDFYALGDQETVPMELSNQNFVGSISLEVFSRLKKMDLIDTKFNFFADFSWDLSLIFAIKQSIDDNGYSGNSDVQILNEILNEAILLNSKLIAVSD